MNWWSHLLKPWWEPEADELPFTEILWNEQNWRATVQDTWEHKQREEGRFFAFLGQHTEIISVWDCSVSIFSSLCAVWNGSWFFIKHTHSFLNTAAFWKSIENDLDSPHNPACWLPIQFTAFFCCWPLIMISRTLVRSIILVSISMMSGCSLAPLMNSSSVSSPEK